MRAAQPPGYSGHEETAVGRLSDMRAEQPPGNSGHEETAAGRLSDMRAAQPPGNLRFTDPGKRVCLRLARAASAKAKQEQCSSWVDVRLSDGGRRDGRTGTLRTRHECRPMYDFNSYNLPSVTIPPDRRQAAGAGQSRQDGDVAAAQSPTHPA